MEENKSYLTKEKFEQLKVELEELTTNGRMNMAEALESAKALGDLKENAEYHQAREDQAKMEDRIRQIEVAIRDPEIIQDHHAEVVEMGARVMVAKKGSSKSMEYQIVGSEESDISVGKLSSISPLAKAMFGLKTGDTFDFKTPNGEISNYRIVEVK